MICPFHGDRVEAVEVVHVDYAGRDRSVGLCQQHLDRALREGFGVLHTEASGEDAGPLLITEHEELVLDLRTGKRYIPGKSDCGCGADDSI